jgi:hypothetical protein
MKINLKITRIEEASKDAATKICKMQKKTEKDSNLTKE